MASELVRELLDSGIHFGHQVSRWNPKMAPYIFGKRSMIHIIDIKETLRGLMRAKKYLTRCVAQGDDVLFVGTKRQARPVIQNHAQRCNMHLVTERWLGGTLTNFRTIRSRLARLEELEKLEENGQLSNYSKKRIASLTREKKKIFRNLNGLRRMDKLPAVLVIIDVRREHIALKEAKKLGIPTICLIDTDSDPDYADLPIPGNDDSMRGMEIITRELAEAVLEGLAARPENIEVQEEQAPQPGPKPRPKRRAPAAARPAQQQAKPQDQQAKPELSAPPEPSAQPEPVAKPEPAAQPEPSATPAQPEAASAVQDQPSQTVGQEQKPAEPGTADQVQPTDQPEEPAAGESSNSGGS